jgi:hypothetical protein
VLASLPENHDVGKADYCVFGPAQTASLLQQPALGKHWSLDMLHHLPCLDSAFLTTGPRQRRIRKPAPSQCSAAIHMDGWSWTLCSHAAPHMSAAQHQTGVQQQSSSLPAIRNRKHTVTRYLGLALEQVSNPDQILTCLVLPACPVLVGDPDQSFRCGALGLSISRNSVCTYCCTSNGSWGHLSSCS